MCKENHTICNVYINLTHTMLGSCFTNCLVEGAWLIYINCVCVCIALSNIHCVAFCFVLFRLVYPKLSVSLDCHFWIALWYSLTFRRLTFFSNCIWTPTFTAKLNNLASVVWHTSLMLFHFNTVTTNFIGEGGYLSVYILEDRCLSFCPITVLLRAIVLSLLLRFTDCNYPLIYLSSYICIIFFICEYVLLRFTDCNYPLIYFSPYICTIFFTCTN
jgi:hypothetical protein